MASHRRALHTLLSTLAQREPALLASCSAHNAAAAFTQLTSLRQSVRGLATEGEAGGEDVPQQQQRPSGSAGPSHAWEQWVQQRLAGGTGPRSGLQPGSRNEGAAAPAGPSAAPGGPQQPEVSGLRARFGEFASRYKAVGQTGSAAPAGWGAGGAQISGGVRLDSLPSWDREAPVLASPVSGYSELGRAPPGVSVPPRVEAVSPNRINPYKLYLPGQTYEPQDLNPTHSAKGQRMVGGADSALARLVAVPPRKQFPTESLAKKNADFKNARFLSQFISETGQLAPRRATRLSAKLHRHVCRQVKVARRMALLHPCHKLPAAN